MSKRKKKDKPEQLSKTTPEVPPSNKSYINYLYAIIAVTIIGGLLRFYNLGYNSLWLDEASTYTFATAGSIWDIWNLTATIEPNPPLFHWIEYVMLFFGNNEFVLRFIPALLGTLTIPVMYFIGKDYIDEKGGLIAAIFFALSPYLIVYSQEARAYSTLLFFIALAFLCYIRALKGNSYNYWILFAVASILAFWTHYYTALFVFALVVYTLVMYKFQYLKQLGLSLVITAIGVLPLAIISIPVILKTKGGGPTFGLQGIPIISETLIQFTGFNSLLTYLLGFLFMCGFVALFLKDRNKSILIIWLMGFVFAASWFLSYKISMVPRYLIFLNIMLALGIAASYKLFYVFIKRTNIITAIICIILITSAPFLLNYYSGYSKDDWRGFAPTLSSMTNDDDLIVIVPGYIYQPLNYYYSNTTDNTLEYLVYNKAQLEEVRKLQGNRSSYYIVTSDITSANPEGDALQWIMANTKQEYQSNNIYVFKT